MTSLPSTAALDPERSFTEWVRAHRGSLPDAALAALEAFYREVVRQRTRYYVEGRHQSLLEEMKHCVDTYERTSAEKCGLDLTLPCDEFKLLVTAFEAKLELLDGQRDRLKAMLARVETELAAMD